VSIVEFEASSGSGRQYCSQFKRGALISSRYPLPWLEEYCRSQWSSPKAQQLTLLGDMVLSDAGSVQGAAELYISKVLTLRHSMCAHVVCLLTHCRCSIRKKSLWVDVAFVVIGCRLEATRAEHFQESEQQEHMTGTNTLIVGLRSCEA
jgi:hypothetical protein